MSMLLISLFPFNPGMEFNWPGYVDMAGTCYSSPVVVLGGV